MDQTTTSLAEALISRRSITPEDAGCQALVAERLKSSGFTMVDLPFGAVSNLLSTYGTTGPTLLFVGHTDVVPPGAESTWQSPPFTPTRRNGRLYGRGAADMKGSVAAFVTACERALASAAALPLRIGILLTSDEEGPAKDGIAQVAPRLNALLGPINWCLVGEPSSAQQLGDNIRVGRRGSLSATVTVTGQGGHVAYPEQVDNPAHRLSRFLSALVNTTWDEGTDEFPATSFQVTHLDTDSNTINMVPQLATAKINLRYSPASSHTALIERIEAIAARHSRVNAKIALEWNLSAEPFSSAPGALRAAVIDSIANQCGITTVANTAGGTSDGRFIAPLGAEVVELGPVNDTIHKIDEYININDLEKLSLIYQEIIMRLAEAASPR